LPTNPPPAADAAASNRRARRHPDTQPAGRRWATIHQAAEYLSINERTVRDMVKSGRLTGYRNGPRIIRIDLDEIDMIMTPYGGAV
jgi:excisionase family DNA binding protein